MPHKQFVHRPTVIKDLCVLAFVNFLLLILFTQLDILETLYLFSREHEEYELDEVFSLGITISISLLIFSYRRIKELGQMALTLEEMALVDSLSGLPNRRAGQISLISWCELARKNNEAFAVFQIDLDKFKQVNDMYSQIVGDEVLLDVAHRIQKVIPPSGQLFRWLDDNFLVVARLKDIHHPQEFAHQLQNSISGQIFSLTLNLTCSIGYTLWEPSQTVDTLLHNAEDALNMAKSKGQNHIQMS
ncbi:GGDEF domain-containing protein [Colwelliaceae bacterium 6441]